MADAVYFDRLKTFDDLTQAGFEEPKARVVVKLLEAAAASHVGDLATNADVAALRSDVEALGTGLVKAVHDLTWRTIGSFAVMSGLLLAAIKLL